MRNRLSAIVAAITAGILITGISWAASDSRTEVTSNLDIGVNQETEIPVDGAGTIRLGNDGASLTILAAVAMEGYVVEVEVPQGREVEADFRGEGRRVQFNAELEDGVVRVRIRTEADATTSTTLDDNSTTSTTIDDNSTTSTTIDDNGDDNQGDDNSTTSTTIDDNRGDDDDDNGTQLPEGPVVYDVSGAASVTVIFSAGGQIELGAVAPASGWTVEETKQDSDEVEVRLRSGEEEARFRLRVDNGQVRVEIERKD